MRRVARRPIHLCWALVLLPFAAGAARAAPQPSAAMLEPVRGLVEFMSKRKAGAHPEVFANRGLCIVENFAPFLFCGSGAAGLWEAGFRAHAEAITELVAQFGDAYDFSESGGRAYFSLPTTWTGRSQGRRFEEHGAWAFVLQRRGAKWRILGYGWGVTAYSETPP